jgi:hypothetical protein
MSIERGLWLEDSGLNTAEIKEALEPAYAVLAESALTPEQAHAQYIEALDVFSEDSIHETAWARAERAITAEMRESAVMALA